MKDRRVLFIATVLLPACFLCRPLAAQDNAAAAAARHCLWKIQGQSNVVYLLGSIHVLKAENFPLPAPLETAFSNSPVAVFETDIAKMDDPQVQKKLVTQSQLPAGQTLQQRLSAQTYAAFTNRVRESGLPLEKLQSMKPSMAALRLSLAELSRMGFHTENGVDRYFADRAIEQHKQIIGLETVDFHLDLLTSFPPDEDDLVMKISLKDMEEAKQNVGNILAAWQTGDSAAIEKFMNDAVREAPAIFKRLVTDRNRSWLPKIEELLRGDKNAIVIVGAAHLAGDQGVVELLRKQGLKVTQL
jgi:uncharacterized protein YbaP (TraB family)